MAALVHALTTGSSALVWAMSVQDVPGEPSVPQYDPDCVRIRTGCHDALFDVELNVFEGFPSRQVIYVVRQDQSPLSLQGVTDIIVELPRLGVTLAASDHPDAITWSTRAEDEEQDSCGCTMQVGGIGLNLAGLLPLGVHLARLFIVDVEHPQGRILISERSLTRLIARVLE